MKDTVFENLERSHICMSPFPHVDICPALDWDYYRELEAALPQDVVEHWPNLVQPYDWPDVWRQFWDRHTSPEFCTFLNEFWGDLLPAAVKSFDHSLSISKRRWGPDAPATRPHVHADTALLYGFLYMREQHDDHPGGGLELYASKRPPRADSRERKWVKDAKVAKTVGYSANRLVMFVNDLNNLRAIHRVVPRPPEAPPRRNAMFVYDR